MALDKSPIKLETIQHGIMRLATAIFVTLLAYEVSAEKPQSVKVGRIFEDAILDISECIRKSLKAGDPANGIPSFDPLDLKEVGIFLDELGVPQYISGNLTFLDLFIEGITGFEFNNVEGIVSLVPPGFIVNFEMNFDKIGGDSDYITKNITVNGTQYFGAGNIAGSFNDFNIKGIIFLKFLDEDFLEVSLKVSVGNIQFQVTGVNDDEQISQQVSDFISTELKDLINENQEELSELVENAILDLFDDILEGDVGVLIGLIFNNCLD